jgi:predicted dinucleotide-binding enzyme
MRIGILGTGDVGRALGTAFVTLGHDVKMGARDARNEKARAWADAAGEKASSGTFAEAAAFGEIVVVATLGTAIESVMRATGTDALRGKILIDTTNPLDFSGGFPPKLVVPPEGSAGEQLQRLVPQAHVVKAFNTVGHAHMFLPRFPGGPPDMFICGDDEGARQKVTMILKEFGWDVDDIGGISGAHYLEAMCMTWVLYAARVNSWDHAFKLLRK